MKKFALVSILSILALTGCTNVTSPKVEKHIGWEYAGTLPAQEGFARNHGIAGPLNGVLNEKYIVVGGGANFPYASVLEGGKKETYSDIYLLENKEGSINVLSQANWINKIGYGASVTTSEGVFYIGGGTTEESDNDILFVSLEDNKMKIEKIGDLPFTFQSGGAVIKDQKIYIYGGKQDGKGTNKFWSYDLNTKEVTELSPVPGADVRTQPVGQLLNDELYVFSGGSSVAYTDGYKYNFTDNTWKKVASVEINGKEISLLGANSVKLNDVEMLVVGGFDKKVWDDANHYLSTLKGKELQAYREKYFGAAPNEYNWNKEALIYNALNNQWKSVGTLPFAAPCGEGLVRIGDQVYSINGEIKPGVRTNKIFIGTIHKK